MFNLPLKNRTQKRTLIRPVTINRVLVIPLIATVAFTAGCLDDDDDDTDQARTPVVSIDTLGAITETRHEGESDGLIGGLGLSGLREPPTFFTDAESPTAAELRRATIHANYTALVDQREEGGFGTLYGPQDDTRFPGREYRAYVGDGINRATLMVQLPDTFDAENPCLVVAPSSGSRNAYGAIGTGGEWGLNKGCAITYTDANKGTGAVELTQNIGFSQSLEAMALDSSDAEPTFVVPTSTTVPAPGNDYAGATIPDDAAVVSYIQENPNRMAFKHAHSQKNIEKDWGLYTLQSIEFALSVLNDTFEPTYTPDNVLIIGASVSNGGAAILRAAEDSDGAIFDGIVVGEPNINPAAAPEAFTIDMQGRGVFSDHSKSLYDYVVTAELYAACASKAPVNAGALFAELRGDTAARCNALVDAGLLQPGTLEELGVQANQQLLDAGFLPESVDIVVGYAGIDLFQSLLATYGNAYTRSSVIDELCHISMAHVVTGTVTPAQRPSLATLAAVSNGIPRTSDIYLIKEDAPSGPTLQIFAPSASGELDYNLEGALCWKDLRDNTDNPLHARLEQGIAEILGDGNLHGVPTIMVHGRADGLIPVNHSSRPYYVLNQQVEGESSQLYYYEVRHSQHLDTLIGSYAGAGMNYVPIDYYFKQSLDLMYAHLVDGAALPASQVVAATEPAGGLITAENLVAIDPAATALTIDYEPGRLVVPE